eukprot:ctg_7465.g678
MNPALDRNEEAARWSAGESGRVRADESGSMEAVVAGAGRTRA